MADKPLRVIHPGVDTQTFRPANREEARQALGLPSERNLVGFVAHDALTDRRKGWHLLLDAISTDAEGRGERFDVAVVGSEGSGSRGAEVESEFVRVMMLGRFEDDTALAQFYSAVDVIVAPSTQEAFGKVGAESLACGTPVVALRGTGLAEIVVDGETGYVASRDDSADLARCIRQVFARGPGSFELACRERATRHFSLERQSEAYIDLYDEILRG